MKESNKENNSNKLNNNNNDYHKLINNCIFSKLRLLPKLFFY